VARASRDSPDKADGVRGRKAGWRRGPFPVWFRNTRSIPGSRPLKTAGDGPTRSAPASGHPARDAAHRALQGAVAKDRQSNAQRYAARRRKGSTVAGIPPAVGRRSVVGRRSGRLPSSVGTEGRSVERWAEAALIQVATTVGRRLRKSQAITSSRHARATFICAGGKS